MDFGLTVLGIWIIATIGSIWGNPDIVSRNEKNGFLTMAPHECAMIITFIMGIGYLIKILFI